jgi:hypothetical protein
MADFRANSNANQQRKAYFEAKDVPVKSFWLFFSRKSVPSKVVETAREINSKKGRLRPFSSQKLI